MNLLRKKSCAVCIFSLAATLALSSSSAFSQVSPTEVKNPRAKADEQKYMPQLVSLQKSIGTANFSRDDAFALTHAASDDERQEILNRSDLFVNGKEFAVGLGQADPLDRATLDRTAPKPTVQLAAFTPAKALRPITADVSGDI